MARNWLPASRIEKTAFRCWTLCVILSGFWVTPRAAADQREIDFDRDIRPIFAEYCLQCHGPSAAEAGLRLDTERRAAARLESGNVAVVPGDPDKSELLHRVASRDADQRMPPEGDALSPAEIEKLRNWILAGANWQVHWSYRPLTRPSIPQVSDADWTRGALDRFVLSSLERADIKASAEANRHQLARRLHLDLIGLPPAWSDVERYAHDASPDADERVVDRLLASPHFGERWGRHWLDKARYADSDGYEKDNVRTDAWRYREWVISAINEDMPIDRFTICQLAGDLLPDASAAEMLATAFHRQTLTNTEGGTDKEQWRVAAVMDRTETLGTVWLGLTLGCARCHSHKYDAITQREYYQLYAFFNNGDETTAEAPESAAARLDFADAAESHEARIASLEAALVTARQQNSAEIASLEKELAAVKNKVPKPRDRTVRVISQRRREPRSTHILRRGEFREPLEPVEPGTLSTLPPIETGGEEMPASRLELARWLVNGKNPLPPRVLANHLWRNMFGEGLVRTMNDFGVRGERPTHPLLLEQLARELIRADWSRKTLIRRIALSATYRQSSSHRPDLADIDPTNRLLYRQNRFRVEAEVIRDTALAASGLLVARIGGPSVFPPIPESITALTYNSSFTWRTSTGGDQYRREMYTFFKRTAPHPNLITFDCPDSNVTNVKRDRSNTPIGALVVLNNPVYFEASQHLADRIMSGGATDDASRIRQGVRWTISREPTDGEVSVMRDLLHENRHWYAEHPEESRWAVRSTSSGAKSVREDSADQGPENLAAEKAAWVALARCLLNLDEFITRE